MNEHLHDDGNLNPDVPEFVPDFLGKTNENNLPSNSKNSEATRLHTSENANSWRSSDQKQFASNEYEIDRNHSNKLQNNSDMINDKDSMYNDESDLWREVKRRSRTSSKDSSKSMNVNTNVPNHMHFVTVQTQQSNQPSLPATFHQQSTIEKEELDFQFDEELEMPIVGRANNFTDNWSDDESDYELSDRDINKILIVTQVKNRAPKHEGYNRTGDYTSRTKISQDLEQIINDGLHNYEEDLWTHDANQTNSYKTLNIITQEDFEKMAPKVMKKTNRDVPPPPPPTYDDDDENNSRLLNQSTNSGFGSKKARFFAVNKEEFIDPRTPRKRKTRHSNNPPVECHVGWVSSLRFSVVLIAMSNLKIFFFFINFHSGHGYS